MFQHSLRQLETLAGHPQADIRLSTEIAQFTRHKLHQLGLDPADTTGPELYAALGQRLQADEARFSATISNRQEHGGDVIADVAQLLRQKSNTINTFAIKSVVAKRLLKANLPKRTMKLLGYRSIDSMLKHESVACLYAAAWLVESNLWSKRMLASFSKLRSNDFEQRALAVEQPTAARWQVLANSVVAAKKHHVLSFKELATVVLLPLPLSHLAGKHQPLLPALTTTVLGLHAINEIRAASTFLKLNQMEPNFGSIVQQVVLAEPKLPSDKLDVPVSWYGIHQYFGRLGNSLQANIFEPMIAAEELTWLSVEKMLAAIEPSLDFWNQTAYIGLLDAGTTVSFNLTDNLLNHCNLLRYEQQTITHFKQALQSEILLKYMSHDKLERIVLGNLQNHFELVPEIVGI